MADLWGNYGIWDVVIDWIVIVKLDLPLRDFSWG